MAWPAGPWHAASVRGGWVGGAPPEGKHAACGLTGLDLERPRAESWKHAAGGRRASTHAVVSLSSLPQGATKPQVTRGAESGVLSRDGGLTLCVWRAALPRETPSSHGCAERYDHRRRRKRRRTGPGNRGDLGTAGGGGGGVNTQRTQHASVVHPPSAIPTSQSRLAPAVDAYYIWLVA